MNISATLHTPIGTLGIVADDLSVQKIAFIEDQRMIQPRNEISARVVEELGAYFKHVKSFNIASQLIGTALQKKIWRAIEMIPIGTAITYGALAKQLHTSPRVIGNACRANCLVILIPCHRVIGKNNLGGYCGSDQNSLKKKTWLLQHEGAIY